MDCLILAAGYATRLYPLTENFPKPLLKVGDKTILDWLLEDIEATCSPDRKVVISNHKFASVFRDWAPDGIEIVDDGTSTNDTRLGAVNDIRFAVEILGLSGDALIVAGDNVLDFSLGKFVAYAREKGTSCIMRYYEPSEQRLHKCGVVEVDPSDRVVSMEEKPVAPRSHWCCPPFYYYKAEDVARIPAGIAAGCGTDAPGAYSAWLSSVVPVHAMEMPGSRFDIGNLESYRQVREKYKGIVNK